MITVKEVRTRREMRKFIYFPFRLFKHNEFYTPPFIGDDFKDFDPKRNPSYRECETKCFLAFKDGRLAGRICALINAPADRKFSTKRMRFRHFDAIDDLEVTKALFRAARDFGLANGLTEVEGPNGFTDMDKEGMLYEGFEEKNLFITYYHAPYYIRHMEALGMIKQVDWFEYRIKLPESPDPRLEKISQLVQKKGYRVLRFRNHRELKPYMYKALTMYDEAFASLYGTVPMDRALFDYYIGTFLPLLNLDYVSLVENSAGEIVGMAVVVPSLSKASRSSRGRLFPFGFFRILHALKHNDTVDMLLIAVKPELQGKGINAVLMNEIHKACLRHGIRYAETGPELEMNYHVRGQWKDYDSSLVRKRRLFIARLDELRV